MNSAETYVNHIELEYKKHSNSEIAQGQKAYMKNNFDFFGLKSPIRKDLQRPYLIKNALPLKSDLKEVIGLLWGKPQREFHYFGTELVFKYKRQFEETDIGLLEFMITHQSWWDTVDFIASNLVGPYFKLYPDLRWSICKTWLQGENMWLQRTALLFQLKYKTDLDTELLEHNINYLLGSKEFFINKAIGWILREYSKTNPAWVSEFVKKTELSSLSEKEALKWLNR